MILVRIKEYIDFKGISVAAFERSIGMSNASFSKSLKNNGAIGTDKLENILRVYEDISAEWLVTGKGEMLKENINDENTSSHETIQAHSALTQNLIATIQEQAEEIGRLKERIAQLEKGKGKDVSDAQTSGVANVG